jgi:hypothetical protein
MYKHHEESLAIMKKYFQQMPEAIALVFGGSVAKGTERPDSDLDAMVIVSPEYYDKRKAAGTLCETINGMCTYPGGYFDCKYMTKEYLRAAAEHGSEPTRNSFIKSRVLFSHDPEIEGIVNRIPVFQTSEMPDKMLSFYSLFSLQYDYFWKACHPDGFMRFRAVSEIIYAVYRMILQENHILFPSNRRLEETAFAAPCKPENLAALAHALETEQSDAACDAFVQAFLRWTSYPKPKDYSLILSRYQADYETWWLRQRPLVDEW